MLSKVLLIGFKTSKYQNMVFKSTVQLGLRWVFAVFRRVYPKKLTGFLAMYMGIRTLIPAVHYRNLSFLFSSAYNINYTPITDSWYEA